jgi:hypothetical protein
MTRAAPLRSADAPAPGRARQAPPSRRRPSLERRRGDGECTHLTVIERGLSCGVAAGHKVGPSDGKHRFRRRGQTAFNRLPTDRGQALVHRIQQQPRRGWCVATDAEDEGSLVGRLGLRDSDWRGHGRRVAAARVQPKVKTGASGGCSLARFLAGPDVGCRLDSRMGMGAARKGAGARRATLARTRPGCAVRRSRFGGSGGERDGFLERPAGLGIARSSTRLRAQRAALEHRVSR